MAFGEKIKEFFIEALDKYIGFYIADDADENEGKIEVAYMPSYLPEGYELNSCDYHTVAINSVWKNQNSYIRLEQTVISKNSITVDNESEEYVKRELGSISAYYTQSMGLHILLWNDSEYVFLLQCSLELPWSEIERMILSIAPRDIRE